MRADRAAWLRISEKLTTLRRSAGRDLPLDQALKDVEGDPAVLYHLLPCPGTHGDKKNTDKEDNPKRKRKDNDDDKGKGKGKGKSSKVPPKIKDLNNNMPDGSRICWNYNLKNRGCKFAKPGAKCKRGSHSCMKCFKDHLQFQCSDK